MIKKLLTALCVVALMGSTPAMAKVRPSGTLVGPTPTTGLVLGSTVTFTASYVGVSHNADVRLQVLCQTPDSSVVYGDVRDLVSSPRTVSFVLGFPTQGTSVWDGSPVVCRADLYAVNPNQSATTIAGPNYFNAG